MNFKSAFTATIRTHALAGGLVGGYALCDSRTGDITTRDSDITCPLCLKIIQEYENNYAKFTGQKRQRP